jgi:branched-chain amino acid transport system substrate-binding protein
MIRNFVRLSLAAALAGFAALSAMAQGPIKIGVIQTYSGPLAVIGTDASNGFELYFSEVGNKVAGRTIQLIKEDDAGNPAQAMERTRRLVEREEVHLLSGITNSAVAYAMRDYVDGRQTPLVIMGSAGANGITNERASPYIFRASFTNRQFNAPFGPYACQKLGLKKIVIMASDFVTGKEQSVAFKEPYTQAGCAVVKEIFAPLGTMDFAPFLSQVPVDQADAVWAMFFGADAIAFAKQFESFGLKAKLKLVGSAGLADERVLQPMGQAGVGMVTPMFYAYSLDFPANQAFIKAYRAKFNEIADSVAASGYVAAKMIATALEAVDGKIEDKDRFLAALHKVKLATSPMGAVSFDDKQNIVFDLHASRVELRDGLYIPVVIEKIASQVDQFWQYKK